MVAALKEVISPRLQVAVLFGLSRIAIDSGKKSLPQYVAQLICEYEKPIEIILYATKYSSRNTKHPCFYRHQRNLQL